MAMQTSRHSSASSETFVLQRIGHIESELQTLAEAPRQGDEGAPDAWLQIDAPFAAALRGIRGGDDLIIVPGCMPRIARCWKLIREMIRPTR